MISEDFEAAFELTHLIDDSIHSVGLIGALPDLNISRSVSWALKAGNKAYTQQTGLGMKNKPTVVGYESTDATGFQKCLKSGLQRHGARCDRHYVLHLVRRCAEQWPEKPELIKQVKLATPVITAY